MELRNLGQSGLKVSVLSLGAMTFGESGTFMKGVTSSDDDARRVFDRAVERGVNLVDTANVYSEGKSEELTGKWIAGKRDKVLLATKCRFPIGFGMTAKPGPHDMGLSRQHILTACEASLKRLGTDVIDLYQVHMQDTSVRIDETLRALDDLVREGKVLYLGCSNYAAYRLMESLWTSDRRNLSRFVAFQAQYSLLVRDLEREHQPLCERYGLGILPWSPLAGGFLSGKYRKDASAPEGSRFTTSRWKNNLSRNDNPRAWRILEALDAVVAETGSTHTAVSLAWLLRKSAVTSVIFGARTLDQVAGNLAAADLKLSDAQMKTLDEASSFELGYPYEFMKNIQGRW